MQLKQFITPFVVTEIFLSPNVCPVDVSLSIDKPKSSLNETQIKSAMETIVAQNIFAPNGEDLVKCVEAKIVTTNTNEYDLA